MGVKDKIGKSAEAKVLLKKYNIDENSLIKNVKKILNNG